MKFIVDLGVVITKVHKVLSFSQNNGLNHILISTLTNVKWLRMNLRKIFVKLMINSVFGKTMENVAKRVDVKLTTCEDKATKYFSKHHFKTCSYKNLDGLHIVEFYK